MYENEIKKVVKLFRKHRPTDLEDILELGIPNWYDIEHEKDGKISLTYIGQGSFRKAYRINNLPLIVKLSTGSDGLKDGSNLEHTQNEIDAFNWVDTDPKLASIRKYLPKVYYTDHKFGVILMHEYQHYKFKGSMALMKKASKDIYNAIRKEIDFSKNFITTVDKEVVLLDWGLLGRKSEWEEV